MESPFRSTSILFFLIFFLCSFTFPQDPEDTTEKVLSRGMRVGVSQTPVWAALEIDLVKEFAHETGVEIEWVAGGESQLLSALESRELDLVIGGITADSPYKKKVALTRPYYESSFLIGGKTKPSGDLAIRGIPVAVPLYHPAKRWVEKKGAKPLPLKEPFSHKGWVAGEEFELRANGYFPTEIELQKIRHVLAAPPGENRWLTKVETFLKKKKAEIEPELIARVR